MPSRPGPEASHDGVRDAAAAGGGAHVVHPHEVRTPGDGQRRGRERPFQPLLDRQAEHLADEPLARWPHEQW